jgi:hypothetical protein
MSDLLFLLLGAGLWALMALLALGLKRLEPAPGERP